MIQDLDFNIQWIQTVHRLGRAKTLANNTTWSRAFLHQAGWHGASSKAVQTPFCQYGISFSHNLTSHNSCHPFQHWLFYSSTLFHSSNLVCTASEMCVKFSWSHNRIHIMYWKFHLHKWSTRLVLVMQPHFSHPWTILYNQWKMFHESIWCSYFIVDIYLFIDRF